ncbi:PREDICTED: galactosylceramide sulfotransferase-like [Branchiostoma belcheri]|uniref:Galactosylceramide sulfotransferase-like n=1 Tax=Branchiostoma belcheri TaxID=7741 RepID=A0A6P5AV64_BRABE|nr:PREDICTED: galactosylceramide sulfotransferase-like [Branchiostoma belcheri]
MQYSRLSPVFVLLLMLSIALYYNVQVNATTDAQQKLPKTGNLVSNFKVPKASDSKKAPKSTKGGCQPHLNVAFLKVHKCASTTVSHVIFRFGHEHDLLVALPAKTDCDIIGHFGVIRDEDYEPPPGGRRWNLFTHHAMYNRSRFRQLMDPDTRYITILRDPLQRLQSAFQYHKFETRFPGMKKETANGTAYITTYLKKPSFWDLQFIPHENIIDRENFCFRNCMSRDLGLQKKDYDNHTAVQAFVQGIENDFTTVMIMEYLPESLVLLKRRMCWTLRDILYDSSSWVKKSTYSLQSVFTREMVENFERHNHADVVLYARFKELFLKQIKEEGVGFKEEVKHFKRVNDKEK